MGKGLRERVKRKRVLVVKTKGVLKGYAWIHDKVQEIPLQAAQALVAEVKKATEKLKADHKAKQVKLEAALKAKVKKADDGKL